MTRPRVAWVAEDAVQGGQAGLELVVTGHVCTCRTAGLAIVKSHHLWCCFCVY